MCPYLDNFVAALDNIILVHCTETNSCIHIFFWISKLGYAQVRVKVTLFLFYSVHVLGRVMIADKSLVCVAHLKLAGKF